jgi:hypothetical protein
MAACKRAAPHRSGAYQRRDLRLFADVKPGNDSAGNHPQPTAVTRRPATAQNTQFGVATRSMVGDRNATQIGASWLFCRSRRR